MEILRMVIGFRMKVRARGRGGTREEESELIRSRVSIKEYQVSMVKSRKTKFHDSSMMSHFCSTSGP